MEKLYLNGKLSPLEVKFWNIKLLGIFFLILGNWGKQMYIFYKQDTLNSDFTGVGKIP